MTSAGSLGKITVAGGVLCAVFAGVAPGVAMAQPTVAIAAYQANQQDDGSDDGGANDDWTTNPFGGGSGGGGGQRSGGQEGIEQLSNCDTLQCLREQAAKQQQSSGSQGSQIAPGEPNPSGGGDLEKTIDNFIQQIMKLVRGIIGSSVPPQVPPMPLPRPVEPAK